MAEHAAYLAHCLPDGMHTESNSLLSMKCAMLTSFRLGDKDYVMRANLDIYLCPQMFGLGFALCLKCDRGWQWAIQTQK